jgi:hypothetical protein
MIKLDKNYTVDVDSTHGFNLNYESEPYNKEVNTKKGKEVKEVTTKETWYYPKLSMILEKYYTANLISTTEKELLESVIRVENNIKDFSKVFAKKGRVFEL